MSAMSGPQYPPGTIDVVDSFCNSSQNDEWLKDVSQTAVQPTHQLNGAQQGSPPQENINNVNVMFNSGKVGSMLTVPSLTYEWLNSKNPKPMPAGAKWVSGVPDGYGALYWGTHNQNGQMHGYGRQGNAAAKMCFEGQYTNGAWDGIIRIFDD